MPARNEGFIPPSKSKLGIGVSWDPKRGGAANFKARVYVRGKELNVGRFASILEAQLAHDQAVSLLPPDETRPSNHPPGSVPPYHNPDVERRVRTFLARVPPTRSCQARAAAHAAAAAAARQGTATATQASGSMSDPCGSDVTLLTHDQQRRQLQWLYAAQSVGASTPAAAAAAAAVASNSASALNHNNLLAQQWKQSAGVVQEQHQVAPDARPQAVAHFVFYPKELKQQLEQQQQLQQQQQLRQQQLRQQQQLQKPLQQQQQQVCSQEFQQPQFKADAPASIVQHQNQDQEQEQGQQPPLQPLQPLQPQQQQQVSARRPHPVPPKAQPTNKQVQQVLQLVMQLVRQQ